MNKKQHRLTKQEIKNMCNSYIAGKTTTALSVFYKVSPTAICGLLERRNIERRPQVINKRRCVFNEMAFDVLTPPALYWLGFFFADGTIVTRKAGSPELAIVLSEKDKEHVDNFKLFLGSSHKIIHISVHGFHNSKCAKRFAVRSVKLTNKIKSYGWKSHLRSIPTPRLTESHHFWRGVVDGDGWIGLVKKTKAPRLQLVGGHPLLTEFVKYIHFIYPAYSGSVRPHKSIFVVGLGGKTASIIIENLYSNAPITLKRKHNAAVNILALGTQGLANA